MPEIHDEALRMADQSRNLREARERVKALEHACALQQDEIQQTLGKALGCPWYVDDQEVFSGATRADGVHVAPYLAEDLAHLAANRIRALEAERQAQAQEIARLRDQLAGMSRWAQIRGDRERAEKARAEKSEAAVRLLFPFVDLCGGEGIHFSAQPGGIPPMDAGDICSAASHALGHELGDDAIMKIIEAGTRELALLVSLEPADA